MAKETIWTGLCKDCRGSIFTLIAFGHCGECFNGEMHPSWKRCRDCAVANNKCANCDKPLKKVRKEKTLFEPGLIYVSFQNHVTVEAAQKLLTDLGLPIIGSPKVRGRGPMSITTKVKYGDEKKWVKKLKKKPEVLQAEQVPQMVCLGPLTEALKDRFFGKK